MTAFFIRHGVALGTVSFIQVLSISHLEKNTIILRPYSIGMFTLSWQSKWYYIDSKKLCDMLRLKAVIGQNGIGYLVIGDIDRMVGSRGAYCLKWTLVTEIPPNRIGTTFWQHFFSHSVQREAWQCLFVNKIQLKFLELLCIIKREHKTLMCQK